MGSLEIREELQRYIEIGDKQFLNTLYETAKNYMEQKRLDRMIAEGEADINAGRLHSQKDVQKMIEDWTKEK
jgi:porphobilinogen deaminase